MQSKNLQIPMRDGTLLSASVLIPKTEGRWPVIIARTPYFKSGMAQALERFSDHGYAIVAQDVRGTGDSEGSFDLLRQEPDDAVDTARWVLDQPFCDGSIGLVGLSYLAPASVAIASAFPQNVKACVWVSPVIGDKGLFLLNGAIRLHHNLPWMALRNPKFKSTDWGNVLKQLPLKDALNSADIDEPDWTLMCQEWDPWWDGRDLSGYFRSVDAPGLHFAGFWDFMLDSAFMGYDLLRKAKNPQVLILGPWSHNGIAPEITKNPYADYGQEASSRFSKRVIEWFDHWMKGTPLPEDLRHACSAYVPGRGWVRAGDWPPAASSNRTFFLGKDIMSADLGPLGEASFAYDPANPVPTEGGAIWEFPKIGLNPGPAPVTTGARPDVLTFRTESLQLPLTCLGPGSVTLFVTSDAPSTDFTAKIVDEDIEGTGRIVADTIYRWRQEDGPELTMELPAIGYVFEAGHHIRLDVSSSNFPKFDRNLNTGSPGLVSKEMRVAHQIIRFGRETPSRVQLAVL